MDNRVLILNPPSPDKHYINRDLMGGMGVKSNFGIGFFSKLISKVKNNLVKLPVMQLVYGATILYNTNFNIHIIDAANTNKSLEEIMPEIKLFEPNYVLMAVSAGCFLYEKDVVAKTIKNEFPNCKIIVVGDMITEMPEYLLPNFDVGITSELEENIVALCNGKKPSMLNGIIYSENGQIKKTPPAQKLSKQKLENLPFPNWELFPFEHYKYKPMIFRTPIVSILTSRGCPYACGYCPYSKNQGIQWRGRSAKNVFYEIKNNVEKFNIHAFVFRDPLFTLNLDRVHELCDMIINLGIDINFAIETRPELLNTEIIQKLSKSGCKAINFGVEDIDPNILKKVNRKPVSLEIIKNMVNECEKNGIRTSCFFIIGLPGSTKDTIEKSISFSKELFPSQVEYKVITPFPGTQLYYMAKENNWLKNEYFDNLGGYNSSMRISEELAPEFLEEKASAAFSDFYFSPKYLFRELRRGSLFRSAFAFVSALLLNK